ncbi:MAG: CocE/NonD family hydrolase [Actinobacteria bacterium]|nr:CocE/NonD family hydrolase [Actinomycetota bacterium]
MRLEAGSLGRRTVIALATALAALLAAALVANPAAARADPPLVTQGISFKADDGVVLHATVAGYGSLAKRPLIVEDSPYAPGVDPFAGRAYNYVELQWRGTGLSGGSLSTTGSRDQLDLTEFLTWACRQAWSNRRIGLYGFSASAIVAYNSMHRGLPCVKAAALMSGTVDLYRDLLYIGGINNSAPGGYVEGAILAPWLGALPGRAQQEPASTPASGLGFVTAPTDVAAHQTEDSYWLDRTFKGDPQHIPILADVGFYDVESRGAFLAYRATRRYGSHLLVLGAHDGWPTNTPGPFPQYTRWFDHYVRRIRNGVRRERPVSLYLSNGSHKQAIDGHWTHVSGSDWPLRRTRWTRLYLSPTASGSARSLNDGSLSKHAPRTQTTQSYPFTPSDSLETDPHTISTISGAGGYGFSLDGGATYLPALTDLQLAEPMSLTYTWGPFPEAVDAVGPASLDVWASSTATVTDLVAILADVAPDGTANPVATGQLRTSYPHVIGSRSLLDPRTGELVEPYPDFSKQDQAPPATLRRYHIEILPIGNDFAAGHRLRLYLVGTSIAQQGAPPAIDSVSIGGMTPSSLAFPTIDHQDR